MRRAAVALAFVASLLCACGGGDGPPAQTRADRNELTGYATSDGRTLVTFDIAAKGAKGAGRANAFSGNPSNTYSVSTENLSAPYLVKMRSGAEIGVATAKGRANLTPLTTLLTIALLGQSPTDAFDDYGDASAEQIALINDAEIARAQADATDFLENVVQVPVRSGGASFVTTPFEPVAGDAMWETIRAFDARVAELGPDAYAAMLDGFIQRQNQCRRAQLQVAIGVSTLRFCPTTIASATDVSDASVLDHLYTQSTGETLTVRVRGDAVLDVTYVTASGARYGCSGPACAGVALWPAAFDTTRSVTLASVTLAGADGSATATGRLPTTVPDVTLADLRCFVGFVHRIRDDGSVDSQCGDNSSALYLLNVSGTLGGQQGASAYADYTTNGMNVVLKGTELVSITAFVTSADGSSSVTAECRGADCLGVTIGPATVNTDFVRNSETSIRTIKLDGTVLRTVAADGSLAGDTPVRLKASLRLIYYAGVDYISATPTDPPICADPAVAAAQLIPDDTPQWLYQVCSDGTTPAYSTPLDSGGEQISLNGQVTIDTDAAGRVVRARITAYRSGGLLGESFGCDGLQGCAGVQVGTPDAGGIRRVAIVGATFHNMAFDGFASGPRPGRVDALFDVAPPP